MLNSWTFARLLVHEPRCKFKSSKVAFFMLPAPEGIIQGTSEYYKAVDAMLKEQGLPQWKDFSGRLEIGAVYLRIKGEPTSFYVSPDAIVSDASGVMNYFYYISKPMRA